MIGEAFGPYTLVALLGRGGMGEVWRAHDTRKDRAVAVKVLGGWLGGDPGFAARFQREAALAARLYSPHIIPIHDYGDIAGRFYIEMPLVAGTDLEALIARHGPMSPERAVAVIEQIAEALDTAHDADLLHRDIKPSNILVNSRRDGKDFAYLIDFGIACAADGTKITTTGRQLGTLAYMAPERFSGDGDRRSDVYALACVLHAALTGAPPFLAPPGAHDLGFYVNAHLHLPPPPASATAPGVPAALDAVIGQGLAKNPADRPAGAGELAVAARAALTAATDRHEPDDVPQVASTRDLTTVDSPAGRASDPPSSISKTTLTAAPQAAPPESTADATPSTATPAGVAATAASASPAHPTGSGNPPAASRDPAAADIAPTAAPPPGAAPSAPPPDRPRRWRNVLVALVAVTLLGTVWLAVTRPPMTASPTPSPVPATTSPAALAGPPRYAPGPVIPVGRSPGRVAVSPDGRRVVVNNSFSYTASVIDTESHAVIANVPVGHNPTAVAVTHDSRTAYVANYESASLSAIDLASNTVVATVAVAGIPYNLALSPDDRTAYVTNLQAGALQAVDLQSRVVTRSWPIAGNPTDVAVTPDGRRAYVSSLQGSTITVIDTTTGEVIATINDSEHPDQLRATPDGRRILAANTDGNSVTVVDTNTNTVTTSIPVAASPYDVAPSPDNRFAYVPSLTDTISVIDLATLKVATTIPATGGPSGAVVTPDGDTLYVSRDTPGALYTFRVVRG